MAVRRKVTLTDVALRAGVSATTASYILNDRSVEMRISADAERRVREAAAALRYRPNRSARALRSDPAHSASRTVAVVSDHLAGGAFASRMLDGARAAARERDHLLIVGETGGEEAMAERVIEEMLDRQVDGVVYATLATDAVSVPSALLHVPAVLLNCVDGRSRLRAVLPDEQEGGATAARAVLEALGDRPRAQVWVVGNDESTSALAGPLRHDGLCRTLRAAGLDVAGIVPCSWAVVPAHDELARWLAGRGGRRPPDVLVCLNDRIAMGCYQALAERQLRVPDDVAVVSFDGSELAGWLRPPVTSVTIPYAEMGALAIRILLEPDTVDLGPDGVVRVSMPLRPGGSLGVPPRLAPSPSPALLS